MKISIITPTFNSEKVIRQNVESVISQNHQHFEHIVIDKLCVDNTLKDNFRCL